MFLGLMPIEADSYTCVRLTNDVAYAGDIVELELELDGCDGFVNLGFELAYDSSVMKLLSVKDYSGVGATCTTAQNTETNPYNIGWDSTANVYFNGSLARFEFLILKNAPAGEHRIKVDYYKGRNGDYKDGVDVNYDENDNPLNLSYVDGYVMVRPNKIPSTGGGGGGSVTDVITASLSSVSGY